VGSTLGGGIGSAAGGWLLSRWSGQGGSFARLAAVMLGGAVPLFVLVTTPPSPLGS
jgi:hypothetical protein